MMLLATAVGGCRPAEPPATTPTRPAGRYVGEAPPRTPADARPQVRLVVQLAVYQINLPLGTVANNEKFWQHVEEQRVDPATYDRLYRSGLRVGQARTDDWPYFKKLIDDNPATTRAQVIQATESAVVEVVAKDDVREQYVFSFDRKNLLEGRSYNERSQNVFQLQFFPLQRRLGDVRVSLTPMVRTLRRQFVFIDREDGERSVEFTSPERRYDCNLVADVSFRHFLVLAPSPEARLEPLLGHAFLVHDGPQKTEQLILLVPTLYRVETRDGKITASPATQPG